MSSDLIPGPGYKGPPDPPDEPPMHVSKDETGVRDASPIAWGCAAFLVLSGCGVLMAGAALLMSALQ